MDRPTIYLANWSSKRHHGPGRKLSIMARPRVWEQGDGRVAILVPDAGALAAVKAGSVSIERYFADYCSDLAYVTERIPDRLSPGQLEFIQWHTLDRHLVADGDTLLCACAVGAPCHRREAAPFLARAGWRVILDGVEMTHG